MTDQQQTPAAAPRKRGRPRKDKPPKRKLTAAERSALARAAWKNRPAPDHKRHTRTIVAAAEVVDEMAAIKGEKTWTAFFCERFGIPPPVDRRRRIS